MSNPDAGPFATLARQQIDATLAAAEDDAAYWQQGSADPERQAKREQRVVLGAIAQRLDHERQLAMQLSDKVYEAVQRIERALSNGPVRSSDLDAGRGVSERTYRRARAWMTEAGLLATKPREGVWWVWLREPKPILSARLPKRGAQRVGSTKG